MYFLTSSDCMFDLDVKQSVDNIGGCVSKGLLSRNLGGLQTWVYQKVHPLPNPWLPADNNLRCRFHNTMERMWRDFNFNVL